MRHYYWALLPLLALFLFVGCKKNDFHDPAQRCKILETSDRFFTYNSFGNPLAFTYKENPDWTGFPTFHFVYNDRQQLIAYGGFNGHSLTYNSSGRVTIDTFSQNYAGQDARYANRLFYDAYGRIVKEISEFFHFDGQDLPQPHNYDTTYYVYDRRGNLVVNGVQYDNKTSLYRVNPDFMLIHRNYSVNNPAGQTQYTVAGLPLDFNGSFLDGSASGIVYDCAPRQQHP